IEAEGMRRARAELEAADLALVVLDAGDAAAGLLAVQDAIADVPLRLLIHNKSDLLPAWPADGETTLHVSAITGAGLPALHARLRALAMGDTGNDAGAGEFSARARHVDALLRAQAHAETANRELGHERLELAAEELRMAHQALGEITGRVSPDDMLGRIFSTFCIGK
ncbi:MAG TPA: tRNA uridine-5-carboxymethylaminomethyl(34) synthesis GTPase MnmE, partial [Pseudoxanthomonas sp.]|nr:tRNA uridine-5-carboxymethylaminomethyl(34) synthesis GTPase MnmE [Pseudoxanthomonas sp.]